MADALNPRYKLKLVKFCLSKLDHLTCDEKIKVVEDNLTRLFKEYMKYSDIENVLLKFWTKWKSLICLKVHLIMV